MDLQQSRGNEAMCDFLKVLKERNIFISTKVQSWEEFALQHINVNQKPWSWDILDIGFDKRLPTSMRIPLMKSDSFTLAFIQKSTLHHEKWSDCVSEDDTAVWRQRNIRSRCCIFDYFCREEAHTEKRIGPETEPCGTPQDRQAGERKGFLAAKQWKVLFFSFMGN